MLLFILWSCSVLAQAAERKFYIPGGLAVAGHVFLTVLEARNPRSGCQLSGSWGAVASRLLMAASSPPTEESGAVGAGPVGALAEPLISFPGCCP